MKVALTFSLKKGGGTPREGEEDKASEADSVPDDLYAECDTPETIEAIADALRERHEVVLIEADENAFQNLRQASPDIAFNIAEGLHGAFRESFMPCLFEMLSLPYTGSDPLTLAISLDKARTKEILSYHGIPTPRFTTVESPDEVTDELRFPVIVKPLREGSSKGIFNDSVVESKRALRERVDMVVTRYRQPVLIEEFLQGREFTVALLGNPPEIKCLPIVEMRFENLPAGATPIYSYEAKWIWDVPERPLEIFRCPAHIDESLRRAIEHICLRAFEILRCRDWCRIDVRLDSNGIPNILELNPLPGILPNPDDNSCFPKAARAAGMTYSELVNTVLDIACKRYRLPVHRQRILTSSSVFAQV